MRPSDFNLAKPLIMWVSLPDRLRRRKKPAPPLRKPLREEQKRKCDFPYNILFFFSRCHPPTPYVTICVLNERTMCTVMKVCVI